MAKHFAFILDGQVMSVYRDLPDATTPEAISAINASRIVECAADVEPGWAFDGTTWTARVRPPRRVIPALEFMDRVPKDKRAALRKFAAGDGPFAAATPQFVGEVADFLDRLRAAQDVRLDGEDLRSALVLLVGVGLLTQAESDALVA